MRDPSTPHPARWRALGLLGVGQFMLILDVTVVAIALPHIGADLGLGRESLTWVVSAYTLAFGGLMLLGGRAADLLGPRALVIAGLLVFSLASLAAGLVATGTLLIAARIAQGAGAAMLSPAALSVVVRLFSGDELNRALGVWSALGAAGAAVGVLLGGVLTAGPGWPWVFLVNVPVGLVVVAWLARLLPPLPGAGLAGGVDLVGAGLVTAATALVSYAFIGAGEWGWASTPTLGLLAAGLALYAALAGWLRFAPHPLFDPGLVTRRPVAAGTFVLFVATALMVAVFFLGTFYLQGAAGQSALMTGVLFLPVAAGTMVGAQVAGRLIGRLGGRRIGVVGLLVSAVGLLAPAVAPGVAPTVVGTSAAALGLGALFVVASATALSQVAPSEAGTASGILSTFHELGSSLGAAAMSGVAAASLVAGTSDGFQRAYVVAAAIALAGAGVAAALVPGRRRATDHAAEAPAAQAQPHR